jgi:hypothetical protein
MALCEECGSIQIARAHSDQLDRLLGIFSSKRPFICRRCGWRGRRDWTDEDLKGLRDYGAGGATPDPELAVLDRRQTKTRQRADNSGRGWTKAGRSDFDLSSLDFEGMTTAAEDISSSGSGRLDGASAEAHSRVDRRHRLVRREIVTTVALTALAMFLVAMLGFTESCVGMADNF